MTMPGEPVRRAPKIVVFSDLCSSTTILEDLLRSESHQRWRDLLVGLKNFLRSNESKRQFTIYKFIGDGWVLLFDTESDPLETFRFLKAFCNEYDRLFRTIVEPVLSTRISGTGVTFGMDRGTLVRVVMNEKEEFIGRPLNVASRLQGAIKERDSRPQGKVLMTNSLYADMQDELGAAFRVDAVTRKLRNITGGNEFRCQKLWLFEKGRKTKAQHPAAG